MNSSVSIITISKDDAEGLARTLASIVRQDLQPREIVLVRAGDSRNLAIASSIAPRVVEVPDPGLGISAAFNSAINVCSGEWLVFLNGGDAFSGTESLATLAAECRGAADADIVACRARTDTGDRIPWRLPRAYCDFLFISHQASAFRRALFDDIGGYSIDFCVRMDLDWMARYLLRRGAGAITFADRVVVDYTLDGLSSRSLRRFFAEEFRVLRRSPRFLRALLGLLLRRLPERAALEVGRALVRH